MAAAISVLDSKSPRRLERPPVASAAGVRVFGTGSAGLAGTVGATLRSPDGGGRTARTAGTTVPGPMSGETTPAALDSTRVPEESAPDGTPAAEPEGAPVALTASDTPVEQVVAAQAPAAVEPLIVEAKPARKRRARPLVLATASAGLTLAGAMLVGGWFAGAGETPEPVSLAGGHAAPPEPAVHDAGEQAELLATEGHFSGVLPVAQTQQAAPPPPVATAPATSGGSTTKRTAPERRRPTPPTVHLPQYQVPRFDLPDHQPPRIDRDHDRRDHDRHRHPGGGRHRR